jgi:hypothetical protein
MADYYLRLEIDVKVSSAAEERSGQDEALAVFYLEQQLADEPTYVKIGDQTFETREPRLPDWDSDAVRERYGLPVSP